MNPLDKTISLNIKVGTIVIIALVVTVVYLLFRLNEKGDGQQKKPDVKKTVIVKKQAPIPPKPVTTTTVIDLFKDAPTVGWNGGILSPDMINVTYNIPLPWQGPVTASTGFVRTDSINMEDGVKYYVLRTHPEWVNNGVISGRYPSYTLKGQKTFSAKLGFVQNGDSLDGVTFEVWAYFLVNGVNKHEKIAFLKKNYDKTIVNLSVPFPPDIPDTFSIELRVDAGNNSISDWAAWIAPSIIVQSVQ